jgi:hypothetical protein
MESHVIKSKLQFLQKDYSYLSAIFRRKKSQISQAINTDRFPTLKNKIVKHIEILEAKNETINQTN